MVQGKAGDWSEQFYHNQTNDEHGNPAPWKFLYFEDFEKQIREQFTPVDEQIKAQRKLYELRQGSKTATDFNIEFQKLALVAEVRDNKALVEQYKRSLNESLIIFPAERRSSFQGRRAWNDIKKVIP